MTPHASEMARLWNCSLEEVQREPLTLAREAAATFGVVVALKGAETWVVAPDGSSYHNTAGNSGLGTAGSGDVLAGIIAGLAARGADALQSAVWGVYLHATAGDVLAEAVGEVGFLASEIPAQIPRLLQRYRSQATNDVRSAC